LNQSTLVSRHFDVIIRLDQGDSAKALSASELVQRRQYELLRDQIDEHLAGLPPVESIKQDHEYGSGWTQFLDGSRGAGKSTFLSSVKAALGADKDLSSRMAFIALNRPGFRGGCLV